MITFFGGAVGVGVFPRIENQLQKMEQGEDSAIDDIHLGRTEEKHKKSLF
jgi:hypothetical protein